jgi:hypothetical protein
MVASDQKFTLVRITDGSAVAHEYCGSLFGGRYAHLSGKPPSRSRPERKVRTGQNLGSPC